MSTTLNIHPTGKGTFTKLRTTVKMLGLGDAFTLHLIADEVDVALFLHGAEESRNLAKQLHFAAEQLREIADAS